MSGREHELAFFISFRAPNLDYGAGVCKLYHFVYEELKDCVYYSECGVGVIAS